MSSGRLLWSKKVRLQRGYRSLHSLSNQHHRVSARHGFVPVLLLVMDGMNFPAFHQLSRSLEQSGWAALRKVDDEFPTRAMSVLPSVTEHSRWALFSGKLQPTQRSTEVVAFRENAALADIRSKGKPLLFTKSDLGAENSTALSVKVRDAREFSARLL